MSADWYVYILECRDRSYYCGITNNLPQRLHRHNSGQGARYTRSRRPCALVYFEEYGSETTARRREAEIKRWRRPRKESLVADFPFDRINAVLTATQPSADCS